MFACFIFPTRAIFETVGQIQQYVLERSKLRDNRFLHVSWKWAARVEKGFYWEGMAEVGAQPLMANLWSSQPKSWGEKKNLWLRPAPSWINSIVHEIFLFPFCWNSWFLWICTFVCINFKDRFRNPHLKTALLPQLSFSSKLGFC